MKHDFHLVEHTEEGGEEVRGPMKFSGPAKHSGAKTFCAHAIILPIEVEQKTCKTLI